MLGAPTLAEIRKILLERDPIECDHGEVQTTSTNPQKNDTTMTTEYKTALRNEAEEICGCILDDCPISGDLLAKLRWIRANGMGRGTDGEIDSSALDALIEKVAANS